MEYKYITDHNLENRQNYMYSQYCGEEFLDAYKHSRLEYIEKYNDIDIHHSVRVNRQISETEMKLRNLSMDDSVLMDAFVKTFEVRKRLYTQYCWETWKPEPHAGYHDMELYLLLAEKCVEFYQRSKRLELLNCLLKVDDTLLSECSLLDDVQKKRLGNVLKEELLLVDSLEKDSLEKRELRGDKQI